MHNFRYDSMNIIWYDMIWADSDLVWCRLSVFRAQSGVVLGCELLRGQGFPDGLLVSGNVEIDGKDVEVPPVSASWPCCTVESFFVFHLQMKAVLTDLTWLKPVKPAKLFYADSGPWSEQNGWQHYFCKCDRILHRSSTGQCLCQWLFGPWAWLG